MATLISTNVTGTLDILNSTSNTRLLRLSHPSSPSDAAGFLSFNSDGTTNNMVVTLGVQYSSNYYNVINIKRDTRNVGIGIASPAAKLQVNQEASDQSGAAAIKAIGTAYGTNKTIHAYMGTTSSTKSLFYAENSNGVVMNIAGDGNVGIGTPSPSAKLQVKNAISTVYADVAPSVSNSIIAISNTQTSETTNDQAQIQFGVNGGTHNRVGSIGLIAESASSRKAALVFATDDAGTRAEKMRITGDGNVGIGTTGPDERLHVSVASGGAARIKLDSLDASRNNFIGVVNHDNLILAADDDDQGGDSSIRMSVDGSEKVRIADNGNVGIGTTVPSKKLDVNGDVKIAGDTFNAGFLQAYGSNFNVGNNHYGVFIGTYSGGTSISPGEIILSTQEKTGWNVGDGLGRIRFFLGDASGVGVRDVAKIEAVSETGNGSTSTTASGALAFHTSPFNSQVAERMRIKSDGNVGIGTTNPNSLLNLNDRSNNLSHQIGFSYVNGGTKTDAFTIGRNSSTGNLEFHSDINNHGFEFKHNAAGTRVFNILNMNVGIGGTPNSSYKLDVAGDTLIQDSESGDLKLVVNNISTSTLARSVVSLLNNTGSSAGLTLPSTNYTGITGWANRLILNTDSGISNGILVRPSTGGFTVSTTGLANSDLRVDTSGNVGIGTTVPSQKLHVQGNLRVTGAYYASDNNAGSSNQVLTSTGSGTDWKSLSDIGDTVTGSGTTNYVTKWSNGANSDLTDSLIYDNGTNVAIGTATPLGKLDILRFSSAEPGLIARANKDGAKMNFAYTNSNSMGEIGTTYNNSTGAMRLWIGGNLNSNSTGHVGPTQQGTSSSSWFSEYNTSNDYYQINRIAAGGGTSSSTLFYITSAGNVGIGGVTPTLGKLQVAGRGYFGPVGTGDATTKALMDTYSVLKLKPHNTNSTNMTFAQVNGGAGIGIQVTNGTQTADWDIALNPYGGNVGIGTPSPNHELEVSGGGDATIRITSTSTNIGDDTRIGTLQYFSSDTSSNTVVGEIVSRNPVGDFGNVFDMAFSTYKVNSGALSEKMRITGDGKVGIGTTDPDSSLVVYKSAADSIIHVRGVSNGADARVRINGYNSSELYIDRNGVGRFAFRRTTGTDDLSLLKLNDDYTDNSTIMFWDYSSGNVGIGTTNPDSGLNIAKNQTSAHTYTTNHLHLSTPTTVNNGGATTISFATSTVDQYGWSLAAIRQGTSGDDTRFAFKSHGGTDGGNERFSILANGNVGIGTTSPAESLTVIGDVLIDNGGDSTLYLGKGAEGIDGVTKIKSVQTGADTDQLGIAFNVHPSVAGSAVSVEAMRVDHSGNLGVGTATPAATVQIVDSTSGASVLKVDGTNGTLFEVVDDLSGSLMSVNDAAGLPVFEVFADNHIVAGRYNQNDFYLNTNGNLGLGTSSPITRLNIKGDQSADGQLYIEPTNDSEYAGLVIKTTRGADRAYAIFAGGTGTDDLNFRFRDATAGADRMVIDSSGNVGINQVSPQAKLHITGSGSAGSVDNVLVLQSDVSNAPAIQFSENTSATFSNGMNIAYRGDFGAGSDNAIVIAGVSTSSSSVGLAVATFKSGGNVGIGTTNPDGNLEIWESAVDTAASLRLTGDPNAGAHTEYANIIFHSRDSNTGANGGEAQIRAYRGGDRDAPYLNFDLANTGGTLQQVMTIHGQNNAVGIGTTDPKTKLHIDTGSSIGTIDTAYSLAIRGDGIDGIQILSDSAYSGRIIFGDQNSNNAGQIRYDHSTDAFRFFTNGTEKVSILPDGNVGIGVNSPSSKLQVVDSHFDLTAANRNGISITDDAFGIGLFTPALGFGYSGNFEAGLAGVYGSADNNQLGLMFFTHPSATSTADSVEAMRITYDGNVGIGTTSPQAKLEVNTGDIFTTNSLAGSVLLMPTGASGGTYGAGLVFGMIRTDADAGAAISSVGKVGDSDPAGLAFFYHGSSQSSGRTEGMRIDSTGNVGIGTVSPSTDFSVKEHLLFNDTTRLLTISNNTNTGGINLDGGNSRLYFSGYRALEGNNSGTTLTVGEGYGTTRISSVLNVVDHETILSPDQGSSGGVASRALTIENINDTSWTADSLTAYNATTSYDIRDRASYSFFSRPTQGNILTFAAQTSNNSTLHRFVNLNSTATEPLYRWDFFQYDGSGTGAGDFKVPDKLFQIRVREGVSNVEKFTIKGNGNVGIGTNNPLFKLHVNGDIYQDTGYSIYSNANRGWYRSNYTTTGSGVSNGKIVTLNPSHGQTASNVYHYIFELTTIGTSTDTGATYIGVYSANTSAWSLRAVSLSGGSSNHPQLSVSGNNFTVYTNHSSNYAVVVSVATVYNGDADSTAHSLGANYQWQRAVNDLYYNDGLVGIGTGTPSQKLHVQGSLRVTGAFYDSNNSAGSSGEILSSTGSGTDWVSLCQISGVTANGSQTTCYIPKWTDGTNEVIGNSVIYEDASGNIGINCTTPSYKLHVNGSFAATCKSFVINHPTKCGHMLRYGSLESPYHGVRLTGKSCTVCGEAEVSLPDYMHALIHEEDVNVQITNYRHGCTMWVDDVDISNNNFKVKTETDETKEFYWTFTAERKDVDRMQTEYKNV